MRIILIKDFSPLGKIGEVKEVASGYARNFLIPKNIAIPATEDNLKEFDRRLKALQKRRLLEEKELRELSSKLDGLTLKIVSKAGKEGKLYGAITAQRIVEELDRLSLRLDKRQIELEQPIKEVGEYEVVIRLGGELNPRVKLVVQSEG